MSTGIKHLVSCHCILPQYKNQKNLVFHKFIVFSIIDDSDTVIPKFASCNNCGAVHKIIDICKTEIVVGRDEVTTQVTREDLKHSMPISLYELLDSYDRPISDFEHAVFIIENQEWGSFIVVKREEVEDYVQGKIVRFIREDKFKVESFSEKKEV